MVNKTKSAFTLAEVLITLVIIGVVAALTIPTAINKMKNANYKALYKKAFADINNVFREDITLGQLPPRNNSCFDVNFAQYTYKKMKEKMNVVKSCENNNGFDCWLEADTIVASGIAFPQNNCKAFVDANGRVWAELQPNRSIYLVDTNGDKKPNQFGKDRWWFSFSNYDTGSTNDCTIDQSKPVRILPYSFGDVGSVLNWCHYPPCYYKKWLIE